MSLSKFEDLIVFIRLCVHQAASDLAPEDALGWLQKGRFLKGRAWDEDLLAEERKRLVQSRSRSLRREGRGLIILITPSSFFRRDGKGPWGRLPH